MTYQHVEMSQSQIEQFLQAPRFAVVGTSRANGAPQLTPVWYLYENGRIYMSTSVNTAKYKNMSRDPRICICIAGQHPDARAVMIYGTAELISARDAWSDDIDWRLTRRYCDSDEEARSFIDSIPADEKGVVVVLTPDKVIADDWN